MNARLLMNAMLLMNVRLYDAYKAFGDCIALAIV